jgi:hypothetical protein
MSRRNGDRSRFDRQRIAKLHDRARIQDLRKKLRSQGDSGQTSQPRRDDVIAPIQAGYSGIYDGSEIR